VPINSLFPYSIHLSQPYFPQDSLYAEAASWTDPAQLERQLARVAERRKRALSGAELQALKQRKQELKERNRKAWLFT